MDLRNNNQFQINYIDYWILIGLRSEPRGWGRVSKYPGAQEHPLEAKQISSMDAGYLWRVLLLLPHTWSQCTPLEWICRTKDLPNQNTDVDALSVWPEHSPWGSLPFSPPSQEFITSGPALLARSARGAGSQSGENHVACSKSRRTSKGQGRLGCLELGTRCMDTWGS